MSIIPMKRRALLIAPALSSLFASAAVASPIDPGETFVLPASRIVFQRWDNLPPGSGQMAKLYGDFDKPGPYMVMMKWHPGWFSAPHSYATDRIRVVVSGTWWVGASFAQEDVMPVEAGGFVRRAAHTWHYDGAPSVRPEPAVPAVFGVGPIHIRLAEPTKPSHGTFDQRNHPVTITCPV